MLCCRGGVCVGFFLCLALPRTFRGATTTSDKARLACRPTPQRTFVIIISKFLLLPRANVDEAQENEPVTISLWSTIPAPAPDVSVTSSEYCFRAMHALLLDEFFVGGGKQGARWGTLATQNDQRQLWQCDEFSIQKYTHYDTYRTSHQQVRGERSMHNPQ
jgi:hypothetical protein